MLSFLCIASYFKGVDFLKTLKREGCTVYFVTSTKHKDKDWPWESIDEVFYMEADEHDKWNMDHLISGLAYTMRAKKIDRVVALDDFDVEKGAAIREAFRIPGMGVTTSNYFRDKLAMRLKAKESGINVPGFSALFNDHEINEFVGNFPGPWVVKPRKEASAAGIVKVNNADELWAQIHSLGDKRSQYLVEQFKPGDVYHIDSLTAEGRVLFSRASKYLQPPLDVTQGGLFRSMTIDLDSKENLELQKLTESVLKAFGMRHSASHTEAIICHEDGKVYFLETSSRVGGANLAEMVEAATGINLWTEWARIELAIALNQKYNLPKIRKENSGIIMSLIRDKHPDYKDFDDKEIVWKMNNLDYHIGLIIKGKTTQNVKKLLDNFAEKISKIAAHVNK